MRPIVNVFVDWGTDMAHTISTKEEDGLVLITMENGERPNIVDLTLCDGLLAALRGAAAHPSCRAVILRASGSVFSAGGDLAQIADALDDPKAFLESLISRFHEVILSLRRLPVPVIACVQGAAAGAGFSLAMACDVVLASSAARFVVGYPKLGTSSDGGLSFQLARRLGFARAFELFLIIDSLDAAEAERLGLVQRVLEPALLEAETIKIARKLASLPYAGIAEIKGLIGAATEDGLAQHLEREREAFVRCASTSDFRERVEAFLKRAAR